ncbi:uncharacterized protein BcabD6B2_30480 [Babesia caballi]|uniref:Uncharacterized protein n=1 Tax=Babesia caballi TaxID=5871 RepID=A0AAV4LTX0_BABCB|nr:hypothetical protein BcabD6B2_30480 [Babesia caballi]
MKLLGESVVGERGRRRLPHPLSELTELLERTIGNVCARPTAFNKNRQKPLAVEVRSQVAAGKRQIAPPSALLMTAPVDVGECLVVKGEAAEEDLGAGFFDFRAAAHIAPVGFIVVRRICFSLKLGDEGRGGVADGGEDGRVGVIFEFILCFDISNIAFNFVGVGSHIADMTGKATGVKWRRLIIRLTFEIIKKHFKLIVQVLKVGGSIV